MQIKLPRKIAFIKEKKSLVLLWKTIKAFVCYYLYFRKMKPLQKYINCFLFHLKLSLLSQSRMRL